VATLIHLNGAPGVGKSTLAERYVAEHPGVLNCDIDRLRCFIGGWADDFGEVGRIVRPLALAMIKTHLDGGHDVLLPQMLVNEDERARFRTAALEAGHAYVHILLKAPPGEARSRFYGRLEDDPLHTVIRDVIDGDGGEVAIDALERRLAQRAEATGDAVCIDVGVDVEQAYRSVVAAIGREHRAGSVHARAATACASECPVCRS
jgi:predicted kinase